jgi:hypothetical protein
MVPNIFYTFMQQLCTGFYSLVFLANYLRPLALVIY